MATTGALRRALLSVGGSLGVEHLCFSTLQGATGPGSFRALACSHQGASSYLLSPTRCYSCQSVHSATDRRPEPSRKPEEVVGTAQARERVWTLSNGISLARLASAPVLAAWILTDQWHLCLPGLALAGVSDWLDGYVAKRFGQESVLGSYLDPLADKAVIICTVGALGWTSALSPLMVGVLVGRDALLLAGGFLHRARVLGWQSSARDFFRTAPVPGKVAAPRIKPILVSKANTVLQFALVGAVVGHHALAWPSAEVADALAVATAGTTIASGLQYWRMYAQGELM